MPARLPSVTLALLPLAASIAVAQVHYHEDGRPWKQRVNKGPDAAVPGWFYNLGVTGLRVQLIKERPKHLQVMHVLEGSPAEGQVLVGDVITGAGGKPFQTEHRNGYGMKVFGPHGPIQAFAEALEACQRARRKRGRLTLLIERKGKAARRTLQLGAGLGGYSATYPARCKKSDRVLDQLLAYLAEHQGKNGSWGSPPQDTFAPLAMLASGDRRYLPHVIKSARFHAETTQAKDRSGLINWRYMAAGIVLSEVYLATREAWIKPELAEVLTFLLSSQYTHMSQINPKARETHPGAVPKDALRAHGGWGHNPGFEGYGPIAMITGQGALAMALMSRCGIEVPKHRHQMAYKFLARGTGRNGYLWYADQVAGHDKWADMGRTGASAIACALSPYGDPEHKALAARQAKVIGANPLSFPDTHGSPLMGMAYAAMGARLDPPGFRRLLDANRWWFTLARCPDGSFYYQPNRDNAGYNPKSRIRASAVVAFIMAMRKPALHITGKPYRRKR